MSKHWRKIRVDNQFNQLYWRLGDVRLSRSHHETIEVRFPDKSTEVLSMRWVTRKGHSWGPAPNDYAEPQALVLTKGCRLPVSLCDLSSEGCLFRLPV